MPNYNLVVTAGYKPYTFDELAKPLMMYKQEYEKYQDAINTMQDNASMAKYYIDENLDKEMLQTHQQYMDDVRVLSDELAGGAGLTAETTSRALALRRRFAKDIAPMLKAAQERDAEVKEQRQALLKNPNLIFSRDAMSTPISEYMKATRDPYALIDLAELQKEAMTKSAAISATYPKQVRVDNAYDPEGNPLEGFVTKRTYSGPKDSAATIMNELEKYKDWDGESDYEGNYRGYAALRKALYDAYDNPKYGDNRDRIRKAINSGLMTGIVSKVDEEVVADPTYEKTSSRTKNGSGGNEIEENLMPQRTQPVEIGTIHNEELKKISRKLQGLNALPEMAMMERGAILRDHPELVTFTTSKLDSLYKDITDFINKEEKARQKRKEDMAILGKQGATYIPSTTRNVSRPGFGGHVLGNNPPDTRTSEDKAKNAKYSKLMEEEREYLDKLAKLKQAYFKEAQEIADLPNFKSNYMTGDTISYDDLSTYKEHVDSGNILTNEANTFMLDDNMKDQLVSGLAAVVPTENGKYANGIYDFDKGKYIHMDDIKDIDFKKDKLTGAIEYKNGEYEFVLYGKNHKRYGIRGLGNFNFRETVGQQIKFLTSKPYDTENFKPIRLSSTFAGDNFDYMVEVLKNNPGKNIKDIEYYLGTSVNEENIKHFGAVGGQQYKGVTLRSPDGKKVVNLIFDNNNNLVMLPTGKAEVWNPLDLQGRNSLINVLTSRWLSTTKGNAYLDYGNSEKQRVTSR